MSMLDNELCKYKLDCNDCEVKDDCAVYQLNN